MLKSNPDKINERELHLLKLLVDRYIREGQPIGSRTLARDIEIELSPATIRNVMADLEEMGLVCSPHTSAGRIPTARGYRLFIDSLLQVKPLNSIEEQQIRDQVNSPGHSAQRLLERVSTVLSEFTHLAGLVMLPCRDSKTLRHVEFLLLSEKRVLVIVVINDYEVQNRIIQTSRPYSAAELESVANYLNAEFIGKDITAVRENLLRELRQTRQEMDKMMQAAIEMADKAFVSEVDTRDFVMAGQTNLMEVAELSSVDKLRNLFAAFTQKQDILQLLDQALKAQGVQIFIGEESGYEVLGDCSVVTSPYTANGAVIGVLGVIGPTRMAYERIIPIVDLTAKLLGSALNHSL